MTLNVKTHINHNIQTDTIVRAGHSVDTSNVAFENAEATVSL